MRRKIYIKCFNKMIKNHKNNLISLLNYFGIISIGIVLTLFSSFHFKAHSQNDKRGKKVKPLIVLDNQNAPILNFDGTRVVALPEIGLSEVFDIDNGKKLGRYEVKDSNSYAVSSDGKIIKIFGGGYFTTYDIDSGKLLSKGKTIIYKNGKGAGTAGVMKYGGQISRNITSDLRLVAREFNPVYGEGFSSEQPAVTLGNLEDNSFVKEFRPDGSYLKQDTWDKVAMTPDGKLITASRYKFEDVTRSKTVVWEVETGKIIFNKPLRSHWLTLSDDGKRLVTKDGQEKGQIEIWDVPSGKLISTLTERVDGKKIRISQGIISPDGKILVTTGNEEFYFWDTETGKFLTSQRQADYSKGIAKSATFSGDGKRIAIGSNAEIVTVWSVDEILKNEKQTNYALAGIR